MFVFIEGDDDERFVETVIRHYLESRYDRVVLIPYAQKTRAERRKYIRALHRTPGAEYIVLGDINKAVCVPERRHKIAAQFGDIPLERVVVVVKEIEAWYLAGLDASSCGELKIKRFGRTDELTKETFNSLIAKSWQSRFDFKVECLRRFEVAVAVSKNESFKYFAEKLSLVN